MTEDEFDQAVASTRLDAHNVELARRHLIDGIPQADVARDSGRSRAAVHRAVQTVLRAYRPDLPSGWTVLTLKVPPALSDRIRNFAAKAIEEWRKRSD